MAELIRNARIDSRLDTYADFFDKQWANDIFALTEGTRFNEAVFDLARAWLGVSHVHAMPWVFATSIDGLLRQKLREGEPLSISQLKGLRETIVGKLEAKGVAVRLSMKKALTECLKELGVEADHAVDTAHEVVGEALNIWEGFLARNEFKTILWSGGRICYAALYYSELTTMRFIVDGPSIPDSLLNARDDGNVVFFCGAGVSRARAGLPDFFGLAEVVLQHLGAALDCDARRLLKKAAEIGAELDIPGLISADRVFALLERDFTISDIHSAVAKALAPKMQPELRKKAHGRSLSRSRQRSGCVYSTPHAVMAAHNGWTGMIPRSGPSIHIRSSPWIPISFHNALVTLYPLIERLRQMLGMRSL